MRILAEVERLKHEPDQLPLLQHLLYRIWENANNSNSSRKPVEINENHLFAAIGREQNPKEGLLKACLRYHADKIFKELPSRSHQHAANVLFRCLAEVDERDVYTRRWTSSEVVASVACLDVEIVDYVVAAFSLPQPYLRRGSGEKRDIDVSHESFIRQWPKFVDLLRKERKAKNAYGSMLKIYQKNSLRKTWLGRIANQVVRFDSRTINDVAEVFSKRSKYDIAQWAKRYFTEWDVGAEEFNAACIKYARSRYARRFEKIGLGVLALSLVLFFTLFTIGNNQKAWTERENNAWYPFASVAIINKDISGEPINERNSRRWESAASLELVRDCLLYTSPSPRDLSTSRMPSSA